MVTPAATLIGSRTWRYAWPATTAPYRVVYRGQVLATVFSPTYDFRGGDGVEPPVLEVLDAGDTGKTPSQTYPPYAVVQWRGYVGASHYTVARKVGAAWVDQETIPETGLGYYTHVSPALEDESTAEFKVTAHDLRGAASDPVYLQANVIAVPEPPQAALACAAGTLTIGPR